MHPAALRSPFWEGAGNNPVPAFRLRFFGPGARANRLVTISPHSLPGILGIEDGDAPVLPPAAERFVRLAHESTNRNPHITPVRGFRPPQLL